MTVNDRLRVPEGVRWSARAAAAVLALVALAACTTHESRPADAGAAMSPFGDTGGAGLPRSDSSGDAVSDGRTGAPDSSTGSRADSGHVDGDSASPQPDSATDVSHALDSGEADAPADTPDTSTETDSVTPMIGELVQGTPVVLDSNPTVNYRGVDIAWEPVSASFLVVYGNAPIGGALLDPAGQQVGAGFSMTGEPWDGANWTQNPRVSAGAGGYLVSWHRELGEGPVVQVRRVRREGDAPVFDGGPISISSPGSNQESCAAVAFSPVTQEFMVVWAQQGLRARRLDVAGSPLAPEVLLTEQGVWVEQPSVVYDPACGCFFVPFMQEVAETARVLLARVGDGTGQLLGTPVDLSGPLEFAKVTDAERDGAGVIASWYAVAGGVSGFVAQRLDASGAPLSPPTAVFAPYGSYDGYDLAWSPVTGTALGVFHGQDVAVVAAELGPDLVNGAPFALDPGGATKGVCT